MRKRIAYIWYALTKAEKDEPLQSWVAVPVAAVWGIVLPLGIGFPVAVGKVTWLLIWFIPCTAVGVLMWRMERRRDRERSDIRARRTT